MRSLKYHWNTLGSSVVIKLGYTSTWGNSRGIKVVVIGLPVYQWGAKRLGTPALTDIKLKNILITFQYFFDYDFFRGCLPVRPPRTWAPEVTSGAKNVLEIPWNRTELFSQPRSDDGSADPKCPAKRSRRPNPIATVSWETTTSGLPRRNWPVGRNRFRRKTATTDDD